MFTELQDPEARYRVSEELRRTSTVRTFRGIDPEVPQAASVKVIGIGSTPEAAFLGRIFRDRCSILERLDHESLPRLLDFGFTESGDAFLAFEWIDGKPAASLTPMSPRQALPIVTRVLEGLECLALHNLVHWNVTPDTIIVPAGGEARLVGLGSSLLPIEWWTSHHGDGVVAERYVAPEFRSFDVGPTAALGGVWWKGDLYSAAMTTCDLLGAEVEDAGTDRPRVRLPTWEANPLLGVLEGCLHVDPSRRPISFSEVIKAIHVALAQESDASSVIVVRGSNRTEDPTPHPAAADLSGTNLFPRLWVDAESRDPTPSGVRALRRPSRRSKSDRERTAPLARDVDRTELTQPLVAQSRPVPSADEKSERELAGPTRPIVVPPSVDVSRSTQVISVNGRPSAPDGTSLDESREMPSRAADSPVVTASDAVSLPSAPPAVARADRETQGEESRSNPWSKASRVFGELLGRSGARQARGAEWNRTQGASILAAIALVLMLAVALWPSSDAEPSNDAAQPATTEARGPVPIGEIVEGVNPPPIEWRGEIVRAYELFAEGDGAGALAALDQLEELEDEAMLTPLECDQIAVLRETLARIDASRLEEEVRVALARGDRGALDRALVGIGPTQRLYLGTRPSAMSVLERGRSLAAQLEEYDATIRGEQFVEAFDLAEQIASRFPAVEGSLRLRERAALGVEQRIDQLMEQGRWELATQAIDLLDSRQPGRAGLVQRQEALAAAQQSEQRWDRLYSSASAALEADRPHEGLEILEGVEPPFEQVARFGDLGDALEKRMSELDSRPPSVELVAEPELRRGRDVLVRLRVEDDYEPMDVKLWIATSDDEVYRQLALERGEDGHWEARISPDDHRDRAITLWAEAFDRSGNRGMLADAESPIEVRRRRWFRAN